MKYFLTISLLIIASQTFAFSQTKFNEFLGITSDSERSVTLKLLNQLQKNPEQRALILIYGNENEARFGNVSAYIEQVKKYIDDKNFDLNRIEFAIAKGKKRFTREFWLIDKDGKFPDFEKFDYDFSSLKSDYLYAAICLACEPSYAEFTNENIDLSQLAKIIKAHSNYDLLVKIGKTSPTFDEKGQKKSEQKQYAKELNNLFSEKYGINNNRIKYIFDTENAVTEFYIVPKNKK